MSFFCSRTLATLASTVALLVTAACSPKQRDQPFTSPDLGDQASGGSVKLDADWPFWPERMRIHPLTMFWNDHATDQPFIEARIEFLDQFSHTVKGVAQFRFELHSSDPGESRGNAFRTWNIDLRDPADNALHYDLITQTYLFRLALDEELEEGSTWYLRAQVIAIDGKTFQRVFAMKKS